MRKAPSGPYDRHSFQQLSAKVDLTQCTILSQRVFKKMFLLAFVFISFYIFISLYLYLYIFSYFWQPGLRPACFVNTRHSIEFQETKYLIKMRFLVGISFQNDDVMRQHLTKNV